MPPWKESACNRAWYKKIACSAINILGAQLAQGRGRALCSDILHVTRPSASISTTQFPSVAKSNDANIKTSCGLKALAEVYTFPLSNASIIMTAQLLKT